MCLWRTGYPRGVAVLRWMLAWFSCVAYSVALIEVPLRMLIVVVSALLLTAILIVLFGDAPVFFKPGRTIYVKFPSAPGVMEGTPVRKSGILIGRVQKVDFAQGSSDVIVTLQIDEGRELWDHEICRISNDSLLGDKSLEFVPSVGKKYWNRS